MKKLITTSLSLCALLLVVFLSVPAAAETRVWDNGAGDNDWYNSANWNPDGSPDYTDNLTVNYGSPATDIGAATYNGGSITFNNSATTGLLGYLDIGSSGIGTLDIKNGANVSSSASYNTIGYYAGSEGTVTVDGYGSTWNAGTYYMYVGNGGTGILNIKNGAYVTSGESFVGFGNDSTGTVNVDSDASWSTGTSALHIGSSGTGTLNITNGATVSSGTGCIGDYAGSEGTVTVDGYNSSWGTNSYDLYVGTDSGTGTLNIRNDAQVYIGGWLSITTKGRVNLSSGVLSAAYLNGAADSLNFTGGELDIYSGDVTISGYDPLGSSLNLQSGQGLYVENGTTTVASGSSLYVNNSLLYSNSVQNDGYLSIGSGGEVYTYYGLTNSSSMNMNGGTIGVEDGTVINLAGFYASGTVDAYLVNYGTIGLDGVLTVNGWMDNCGSVDIYNGDMLQQNGLENYGTINLYGGSISSGGGEEGGTIYNYGTIRGGSAILSPITNDGGLIRADSGSTLLIADMSDGGNINGGEMRVEDGSGITVMSYLPNAGTIVLNGPRATFSGGPIWNTGTIIGSGRVSNSVNNDGIIRACDETLTLSGPGFTNSSTGRIEALEATVFVTQGLANNDGAIVLEDGDFDNATNAITNYGSITGFGMFRSGGLTNNGHIGVGYGDLGVIGTVINDGTCYIEGGSTAVFFNDVSGSGTFDGSGTAMFLGALNPGHSPGVMSFETNVTLGSSSTLIMELAGLLAGEEYDVLDVGGIFALADGTLDIELINLFVPQAGNVFDILDFDHLHGAFGIINLPELPAGLAWDTSSLYTTGELGVIPEPATICLLGLGALSLISRKK